VRARPRKPITGSARKILAIVARRKHCERGIGEGAWLGRYRKIASTRSLDVGAADHGGSTLAARMHVAERERVPVELSIPEAVGVGEDEAPVVLAGEFADEGLVGLLAAA
jgi:hypothetical protein